ncbi:MAG: D-tyrosyl-tRNA(Tyr) deacylase [Propionibacteriaceae bacterium]|jgi:D-tyrosyl-tRNA(Tyr) deacylase|nr:D-tyrosyl-tRNA(Tyr) deacylase [Propionibacteriaceae bacterium]
MRMVVQRASRAEVRVDGAVVGRLPEPGLVVLVGVTHGDTPATAEKLAAKVWDLRLLDAGELTAADHAAEGWSKGDVSASEVGAPLLVISQFTLYARTKKGRRPSWSDAAPAALAEPLVAHLVTTLRTLGAHVETGQFGALMDVELVNHGPVTLILEA